MNTPKEIIINEEIAYQYINNPYYYITKTGILYSTYIKGAHGKSDINKPHKVAYGQDKDGYYRCVLSLNGKHKRIKIHQIMAIQFLGYEQYKNKLVINHIDGNKHNNKLDNLEIVTIKENNAHAWKTGLNSKDKHPFTTRVDVYDNETKEICHFNSMQELINSDFPFEWRYINYIKNKVILFHLCLFKKIITGKNRFDYKVECYYNGVLFKTFNNVLETAQYFNKQSSTISSAFKSKYPKKVNRYTLTFPNVSTIESIITK